MNARYIPNGIPLTDVEAEIIDLLIEEASEVIHAASKLKRFGKDDQHPERDETNTWTLALEVGDLVEMIDRAHEAKLIIAEGVMAGRLRKQDRLKLYSRFL